LFWASPQRSFSTSATGSSSTLITEGGSDDVTARELAPALALGDGSKACLRPATALSGCGV
jgi:hypothetical protein